MSEETKTASATDVEVKTDADPIEVSEPAETRGPLATLADIEKEVERSFNSLLGRARTGAFDFPSLASLRESLDTKLPKVDVIDRDSEIVVEAELPGLSKDDIDVSLADDSITIKTNVETRNEEEGEFHRREIRRESSTRTLSLPATVDTSAAKASFEDGVLRVSAPKTEATRRRKVEIG